MTITYFKGFIMVLVEFFIGGFWYSDSLFAERWMRVVNLDREKIKKILKKNL